MPVLQEGMYFNDLIRFTIGSVAGGQINVRTSPAEANRGTQVVTASGNVTLPPASELAQYNNNFGATSNGRSTDGYFFI